MTSGDAPSGEAPPGEARSGERRIGRTALVVVVQCLLALLVVEVALRLAQGRFEGLDRLLYLPEVSTPFADAETLEDLLAHSLLGYHPLKGSSGFVLNSRGLRTPEYETAKEPGTLRLVVVGDSFAYASGGTPYAFHWPYLTAQALDGFYPEPVELVNLGAPGVGPGFYYRIWQIEGSRLGADRLVVSFYVGNDLTDEQGLDGALTSDDGWLDRLAARSLAVRAGRALFMLRGLERSEEGGVETTPEPAMRATPTDEDEEGREGGYEILTYRDAFNPEQPGMKRSVYVRRTHDRMRVSLARNRPAVEARLDDIFPLLESMRRDVEAAGGEFTLLIIPDEYQVSEALRELVFERVGGSASEYDLRQPQDVLLERCERAGMDCLDLLPEFESVGVSTTLYKPRDTHWNLEGNALAARLLVAHLLRPKP